MLLSLTRMIAGVSHLGQLESVVRMRGMNSSVKSWQPVWGLHHRDKFVNGPSRKGERILTKSPTSRPILRSVGAVLTGMIVSIVLSLATDLVLHAIGLLPPVGQPVSTGPLLLATAYLAVCGIAGAYITARLAPGRPMLHAMVFGCIGLIVSILGAVVAWKRSPAFGPHWYPIALMLLALPTAWLGSKLYRAK